MSRRARWSRDDVLRISRTQCGLITAAQLASLQVSRSTVSRSDELGGMFSFVLPGVHRVEDRGPLTPQQQGLAAMLYAGHESVLTGAAQLRSYGIRAASRGGMADLQETCVLVPHAVRRVSRAFVRVERTVAMPRYRERDGLRVAVMPRLVLDAVRRCTDSEAVRAVIFEVVQRGLCSPESLDEERRKGQIRGSRFARLALEEAVGGARSIPEGDVRRAFLDAGWSRLAFNPRLDYPDGRFLASPDVYDRSGVCLEIDSREHHFAVDTWEQTMARHARMTAAGLAVLHITPRHFADHPDEVLAQFSAAVNARVGWPSPGVLVHE